MTIMVPDQPSLSPDGRRIAWSAAPRGRTGEHREDVIFVAPTDGSGPPRQWTERQACWAPSWSPTGTQLAFLSDQDQRGVAGIRLSPLDGGESVQLVRPRTNGVSQFRWSPCGPTSPG